MKTRAWVRNGSRYELKAGRVLAIIEQGRSGWGTDWSWILCTAGGIPFKEGSTETLKGCKSAVGRELASRCIRAGRA